MIKRWLLKWLAADIEAAAQKAAREECAIWVASQKKDGPAGWKPLSAKIS